MPKTKIQPNTQEISTKKVASSATISGSDLSFLIVDKSKILGSADLNLSASRYRVTTDYSNAKWPMVELGDFMEEQILRVKENIASLKPLSVSNSKGFILSEDLFNKQIASEDLKNYKIITNGFFAYNPSRINVGSIAFSDNIVGCVSPMYTVFKISKEQELNVNFLFLILKSEIFNVYVSEKAQGGVRQQLKFKDLQNFQVPLPPLSVQEEIVREITQYQKIIDGAKQVIENWKPKIDIDPEWPKVKLGEVCDLIQRGKSPVYGDSDIQVIKSGQARGYFEFNFIDKYFVEENFKIDHRKLQKDDLLLNSTGVGTAGRITYFDLPGNFLADGHITILRLNEKSNSKFFLYFLDSKYGFKGLEKMATGNGGQIELGLKIIESLEVSIPFLGIQNYIVSEIEKERELVEGSKKLAEIYENKVKNVIQKIWN